MEMYMTAAAAVVVTTMIIIKCNIRNGNSWAGSSVKPFYFSKKKENRNFVAFKVGKKEDHCQNWMEDARNIHVRHYVYWS